MGDSLIGMEVREQGCRTNMVRWNTGVQDDMIDLQETARSGGDRLDQEDWVRSTPMDTSYEEIPSLNEPKTYIEDAMSEDRINHDEILEHTLQKIFGSWLPWQRRPSWI